MLLKKIEEGEEESSPQTIANRYDLLPYVLCYVKVGNVTIDQALETEAVFLLNVVQYEVERIEKEMKQIKKQP